MSYQLKNVSIQQPKGSCWYQIFGNERFDFYYSKSLNYLIQNPMSREFIMINKLKQKRFEKSKM